SGCRGLKSLGFKSLGRYPANRTSTGPQDFRVQDSFLEVAACPYINDGGKIRFVNRPIRTFAPGSGGINSEQVALKSPTKITTNSSGSFAFFWDSGRILGIQLSTGAVFTVASPTVGGGVALPFNAAGIVVSPDDSRLYIADGSSRIFRVNLANGDRSLATGGGVGAGPGMQGPQALAVTRDGGTAYVADVDFMGFGAFFRVDLATGNRTQVNGTGPSLSCGGGGFGGIALNSVEDHAFYGCGNRIYRIELSSGNRTEISNGATGTTYSDIADLRISQDGNYLYIVEAFGSRRVLKVRLSDDARVVLSGGGAGSGPQPARQTGIALAGDDRLLIADADAFAIFSQDISSRVREHLLQSAVGSGQRFSGIRDLSLSPDESRLIVTDAGNSTVWEVDIATGARTELSSNSLGTGHTYNSISPIKLASGGGNAYVQSTNSDTLLRVNLTSGNRSIISNFSVGTGPNISIVQKAIAANSAEDTFWIADDGGTVFQIDGATGNRSIMADFSTGTGGPLTRPRAWKSMRLRVGFF
ncbi:MAG: hypothetical protein AAF202_01015, partial [Pseudomonadota bacterium]